jgi:hypothetical protein
MEEELKHAVCLRRRAVYTARRFFVVHVLGLGRDCGETGT